MSLSTLLHIELFANQRDGVFKVAIVFDSIAAVLAFFVLRRLKAPGPREVPVVAPVEPRTSTARA